MHFFVRFEPQPGREAEFREALRAVMEPSRAELGCVALNAFETIREPIVFTIHSVWADEEAFETHAKLPHTMRFIEAAERLLTHAVQGMRMQEL